MKNPEQAAAITRNMFLKDAALASGVITAWPFLNVLSQFDFNEDDYTLNYLETLRLPHERIPDTLVGTITNDYLGYFDTPDVTEQVTERSLACGAVGQRIFIGDHAEPEVGAYKTEVLDKVIQYTGKVHRDSGGQIGVIVSLYDGFPLLHADKPNLAYGSNPLSSPYLGQDVLNLQKKVWGNRMRQLWYGYPGIKHKAQAAFFTDTELIRRFSERVRMVVNYLKDSEGIIAWEVMNEPEIPQGTVMSPKKSLTDWFSRLTGVIRAADSSGRPIVTGLADPSLIDERQLAGEGVVNSVHDYINLDMVSRFAARRLLPTNRLPLLCTEAGISQSLLNIPLPVDRLFPAFLNRTVEHYVVDGVLYLGGLGVWHVNPGHRDNYPFDPQRFTGSARLLSEFSRKVRQKYGLPQGV